jgi:hypothetical protein
MSQEHRPSHAHAAIVSYFPMFIATLSVLSSIYQGYLFAHSNDIIQRNVARGQYLQTCREIIDTYFQFKLAVTRQANDHGNASTPGAGHLVGKFGALGTYLANFQDENIRVRYTALTQELAAIAAEGSVAGGDVAGRFAKADDLFGQMNDDCVRLAQVMRM